MILRILRDRRSAGVALLLVMAACARKPTQQFVTPSAAETPSGVVAVTVTGREGACDKGGDDCAIRSALEAVLFRGVPGTSASSPLLSDEASARKSKPGFFDDLLKGRDGRTYVTSATRIGKNTGDYTVLVQIDRLRTTLVREGLLRRFGY
jgi:hypothetical protein